MELYIVIYLPHYREDEWDIEGVFDSAIKAEEFIKSKSYLVYNSYIKVVTLNQPCNCT